jgi:hypothetical protein
MNKFGLGVIVATILIIAGGIYFLTKSPSNVSIQTVAVTPTPNTYEYFWGDGCPHCINVAKFMETWDKKDKVKINKMEVWKDKNNANIMLDRANKCGLDKSTLGVPLLYTPDGECFDGDGPIIEVLKGIK